MVALHRLGRQHAPFHLNADLILSIEAHPDTVVTLTTGTRIVVEESPAEVVARVLEWRTAIASGAWTAVQGAAPPLALVED